MRTNLIISLIVFIALSCKRKISTDKETEQKAIAFVQAADSASLSLLRSWDFTNRMNYYHIWTKVKREDSLSFSMLYEKIKDTSFIEVYNIANFLKDYKSTFDFDRTNPGYYRIGLLNRNIINVYPDGQISGKANMILTPIPVDSFFSGQDPFTDLEKIDRFSDKFNFFYSTYSPAKANFIRFSYDNRGEDVLYYLPSDLYINDKNLYPWVDKFSKGKRIGDNWILVKNDTFE